MFKMAAIVGNRSFPVILKEFEPNLDPRVLQIAEVSRKCSILATLESGGRLHLWNIRSGASWSLTCVKQFRWCFFEDSSNEDVHGLLEYPFAVLKSDNSVELFSLSKGAEQLSCVREVIVTKDVLKGLLRDRGKDWLGETDVLSASMDLELAVYEVAVLLDRKFVAILSVSKSEKANMHCCFALDHPDGIKEVPLESIIQVRKCNQFFFTLLYNGVVLIHNMCDLVGSVDVWSTQNIEGEDHMEIQPRPTFCQMEVADNISLLVCTDTSCNVYLVNLDEYLHEQSPQQFSAGGSKFNGSRLEYVRFQYELGDEDSVARDVQMSGVAYGDRVWKTELLAFRRDAKQPCFQDFSDQHQLHSNSLEKQWPVNVLGDKGDCTSSVQLVGQLTRQGTATDGTPDRMLPSQCLQNTQFVPSQTWMELFYVERLSVTPDSFLLWLKAKLLQDQPQSASGSLHGVLCLFSFTSQEFVYHWLSEPSLLVRSCETIQPALLLNSTSLTVPAFDISQDQLVHKVIIYESARLADSLCHVNQWNHCTIPMHALEVALKLRQLDTVAFFLKNQEKAFTNQDVPSLYCSSSSLLSSSPLDPSAARQGQVDVDTTDVKQVTEALVRAVNYNMKQQHNLHFTRQLAQMTLNYLQNLMKDGAGLLDAKCVQDHCDKTESEEVASTPCHQEVKECLEFFTSSTVELRQHVSSMPVDENEIIGPGECGTASFSEMEVDEENEMMRKWTSFNDEEVVEDAIANRQICSAQTFFQCRKQAQRENIQCDGSFASLTRLGLTVVLQKLVDQDMDTAFMLLTNMGRSFLQQVHRICLYTLHRPLRDLLVKELDSRNCLSPTEKEVIEFVHNVEVVYSQPSFTAAKRILEETTDNWKDLGLLQSSFNLGSNHILEMYIKSGNLLSTETNQEGSSNSSHYVELPLDWAHTWDDLSKQRILVERMLVDKDSSILTCDVRIGTKALWHYLTSHADCQTLLDWIRLTASHEHPMGDTFAVQEGDVVFPSLSQDVLTQLASCLGILKHMVLEELIWNGMYTSFQLSDFSLLLHYMGKTQTLFGDSHPMSTLDRCIGSCTEEPLFDAEGCIVSVTDFHCNFIDYCVRLKLVNLLHHYLDFYRLGETVESVRELKLDLNQPAWIDLLVKFRCLGRYSTDPAAVFEASLSNSGVMVNTPSSSITGMLKAGHPVMAFSCLLYGPTSLNQAISSSGSVAEMSVWQVEESLLFASLAGFPKLRSAVFPVTSGFHGIEPQDVSVYQLLQGNCPFEVSRLFGWQPTNELAHNRDTPYEMPHFSQSILVAQHAHVEGLTFSYYLRHGRPSFAFASFIGDQLKEKTVSKARIQHAAFKAYRVAVQHLTHQEVCSACVAFTEMLGLNSNPLRVDIQAANRVLAHAGKEDLYEIDSPEGKTMENVIASELLSCARKTNRQPKNLLRALESATRNCISKECLDRTSFEAGQLWHLVILFCRVHKIELSTTFLQDCARADKWLPFVCHAHVCQFPKFQVLHVIEREFSNTYIKEHLQLAFDNVLITKIESAAEDESARRGSHKKRPTQKGEQVMKPTRDVRAQFYSRMGLIPGTTSQPCLDGSAEHVTLPSYSSSAEDEDVCRAGIKLSSDYDSEDSKGLKDTDRAGGDYKDKLLCSEDLPHNMFDILFKCQSVEAPWQSLVAHAIALRRSFLSVLAACYKEARVLDCLCAWLCSIVSSSVMKPAVAFIIGSSQTDSADIQSLQWHRWNLHDLSALIFVIAGLKEKLAHTLTRAFYIFDPKSPLVDFFHFYESCLVHSDYEACQEYLNAFKKSHSKMTMKSAGHEKTELPSIGNVEWLESLTIQVTKQMLSQCESTHKQCHLLALLAQSMFGRNFSCQVPNYHKLHEISAILHGTAIEVKLDLLLEENSKGSQDEKERVMHSLLNAKHFGEARRFAVLVDLPDDHITLKEVEADLQRTKNSLLWEIEQGRLAFWHKAEKCFRNNSCDHETVGSFFESQADDEHLSFTERARLLGIAVKWFSIPATDQQPRTAAELRELQKRRWLFKIQAEMENNCEAKLVRSVSHLEFLPHESEVEISGEIRSSNMEAIYHKMSSARELVQEDGVDIKSNDGCPLKTDKEIRALEHVIGQLLEGCHITQARWLAGLFNHSSLELDVIMSCIHLAQGTRSVETLDDHIQTLLSQKGRRRQSVSRSISRTGRTGSFVFNSNFTESNTGDNLESASSAEWIQVADIIALMESLAFHCRWGKRCCSCIITCYKVAQTLVQDYETIVNEKPFNVLHSLLVSGFDSRYKLIESYIKAMQLDTVEVTKFLADTILKSLRVYSTGEELSGGEYGDLIVNASPSCDDTSHMIRLCPDYSLLGSRLLDTAISLASERASSSITVGGLNLEVELLVRAHECHTLACNMEGIAGVLRNGRMLTAALAEAREYSMLVRLLTGVGRFHEMSYIFDTLFEHEHFELLCRTGIDKENKLKVALLEYLRRQHPDDTDKFSMVAHHFRMYREIAQTLEETAVKQLRSVGDCFPERKDIQGAGEKGDSEVFFKLNSIMKSFCYASDNYAKENCWRHSQSCLRNARLVRLQIEVMSSGVTVVNLDEHALKKFLTYHTHFFQSLLVAEAYKKRDVALWIDAIYLQVVVRGDFNYLQDMRSAMPLTSTLFVDVANKYKSENTRSSQAAANMRRLLGHVNDVRIRYKLATELNFRDLATSILEEDGGAFLRDVMVP